MCMYKCINESLCCTSEINTVLYVNYISRKKKENKKIKKKFIKKTF